MLPNITAAALNGGGRGKSHIILNLAPHDFEMALVSARAPVGRSIRAGGKSVFSYLTKISPLL